ncbi:hypothetical protein AQUSIP_17870 [Aquicella siphonis]|uniref:Uncharacterized protein n=1 Tax=Aquicella siphonis TaxID=254247 RepID=A0A5E4PHT5_9COXI|nr:GNAT family N-acetyltransferase [Aquicella siphonis]VVC76474.1 hypothetical protein AQUSIP_17870 [Aquicella siphonis]
MYFVRYTRDYLELWNDFVRVSKNGTFLLMREYMEYHNDRYEDNSFLIFDDNKNDILALFPANRRDEKLISHEGLTYGGFIVSADMTQSLMNRIFVMLFQAMQNQNFKYLQYKTIPSIYHKCPSEEDHYSLFAYGANLYRRDILTVIDSKNPIPFQNRRIRQVKKAKMHNVCAYEINDYEAFWNILEANLAAKYKVKPVHSIDEIKLLSSRFPSHLRLFGAYEENKLLAGVLVYETDMVAHFQYIASSDCGRKIGALDFLFSYLIGHVYSCKRYIDFGISNENNGQYLNLGLIEFKEGFGGRSIKHDFYELDVSKMHVGSA